MTEQQYGATNRDFIGFLITVATSLSPFRGERISGIPVSIRLTASMV